MNTKKGVKDLMKEKRFSFGHLQKALMEREVPGNWDTYQNVYNLINGTTPRDAYAYIVLSDLMDVDLRTILLRYSAVEDNVKKSVADLRNEVYEW